MEILSKFFLTSLLLVILPTFLTILPLTNGQKPAAAETKVSGSNPSQNEQGLRLVYNQLLDSIYLDSLSDLWPEVSEILEKFNAYIIHQNVEHLLVQFFAILNLEPEFDKVLSYLTTHGFPELRDWPMTKIIGVALNRLISPSTRFPHRVHESNLQTKVTQFLDKMWLLVDSEYFMEDFTELLETNLAFQDLIIEIVVSSKFVQAYQNLKKDPKVKRFFDILRPILGPKFLSFLTQTEEVLGWTQSDDQISDKFFIEMWRFNSTENWIELVSVDLADDDKIIRVHLTQIRRLDIDLKSVDGGRYGNLLESISPDMRMISNGLSLNDELALLINEYKMLRDDLSTIVPGEKRSLHEIRGQIQSLDQRKKLIDQIKSQAIQLQLSQESLATLRLADLELLTEAKSLAKELKGHHHGVTVMDPKLTRMVEKIIIDLVLDHDEKFVLEGDLEDRSLRTAFNLLWSHVDVNSLLTLFPEDLLIGSFGGGKNFGGKVMAILDAAYEAPGLKNILVHLEANGFPEISKMSTKQFLENYDFEKLFSKNKWTDNIDIFDHLVMAFNLDRFVGDFFHLITHNSDLLKFLGQIQRPEVTTAFQLLSKEWPDLEKFSDRLQTLFTLVLMYSQKNVYTFEWDKLEQVLEEGVVKFRVVKYTTEGKAFQARLVDIEWTAIAKIFSEEPEFQDIFDHLAENGLHRLQKFVDDIKNLFDSPDLDHLKHTLKGHTFDGDNNDDGEETVDGVTKLVLNLTKQYLLLVKDVATFFDNEDNVLTLVELMGRTEFAAAFRRFTTNPLVRDLLVEFQDYGIDVEFLLEFTEKFLRWDDCPSFVF